MIKHDCLKPLCVVIPIAREICDKSEVALGESNVASDAQAQRNTTVAEDDAKQQREPKALGKYLVPADYEEPQPSEISPIYEDRQILFQQAND